MNDDFAPTAKRDKRPHRGGWAPGGYICKCSRCNEGFIGDKRAMVCADCAYAEPELTQEQKIKLMEQAVGLLQSGWAGVNQRGTIVDRRDHPNAVPIQANPMFGAPEPKHL